MTGWTLALALVLFPQYCPFIVVDRPAVTRPGPDVVSVFARELRPGMRVTVGLMDNQKLKGEFLGVRDNRLLLRADRDRSGAVPIAFPAIHSIAVQRGGSVARP